MNCLSILRAGSMFLIRSSKFLIILNHYIRINTKFQDCTDDVNSFIKKIYNGPFEDRVHSWVTSLRQRIDDLKKKNLTRNNKTSIYDMLHEKAVISTDKIKSRNKQILSNNICCFISKFYLILCYSVHRWKTPVFIPVSSYKHDEY